MERYTNNIKCPFLVHSGRLQNRHVVCFRWQRVLFMTHWDRTCVALSSMKVRNTRYGQIDVVIHIHVQYIFNKTDHNRTTLLVKTSIQVTVIFTFYDDLPIK